MLINVDASEARDLVWLNRRCALNVRGEVELEVLKLCASFVSETVELYGLLKRQLLNFLLGWPVEFDSHLHTDCFDIMHDRLPPRIQFQGITSLILKHSFNK